MKKLILFFIGVAMLFGQESVAKTSEKLAPSVKLNSGYDMPILGLGTWTYSDADAESLVYFALKNGYRHIDSAQYYGNEKGVGKAVRRAITEGWIKREEVFVTTKIMPRGKADYEALIDESNARLGLGYIDLMLIHQRGSGEKELYAAIEKKVKQGVVRSLGISNFYAPSEFESTIKGAKILPSIIQNENHIFYQNAELKAFVSRFGVIIQSYFPLGGRGKIAQNLNNETIKNIAKKHNKTPAQVILRWHTQMGYAPLPGSQKQAHIKENIEIFDFTLDAADLDSINALNTNNRYERW